MTHRTPRIQPAGTKVVVAETYARIFFRNCISTGEMYPVETDVRLCDVITTGQEVSGVTRTYCTSNWLGFSFTR